MGSDSGREEGPLPEATDTAVPANLAAEAEAPRTAFPLLYPRSHVAFPWLPERRGKARLIVGDPLTLPPGASYREAAELAKRAILDAC